MADRDPPELGPLTRDRLTRDLWVYQRAKGHRFSSDDVVTAHLAVAAAPAARRILDLGCGLGSVLLHLAWSLPEATLVGVEAQAVSFELLRRNVAENQLGERVAIHHGDLRDPVVVARLAGDDPRGFSLITGTPPYFPVSAASPAMDEQRAYARIEYRGGVEGYLATGGQLLADGGTMVLCGDARTDQRVLAGAALAGLAVVARCDVIPRTGEPALFSVWTARHLADAVATVACSTLTLRDAAGDKTPDAARLKAFSGFA